MFRFKFLNIICFQSTYCKAFYLVSMSTIFIDFKECKQKNNYQTIADCCQPSLSDVEVCAGVSTSQYNIVFVGASSYRSVFANPEHVVNNLLGFVSSAMQLSQDWGNGGKQELAETLEYMELATVVVNI